VPLTAGERSAAIDVPGVVARGAVEDGVVGGFRRLGRRGRERTRSRWRRRRVAADVVFIILAEGLPEAGIVWDARGLALDELSQEGELEGVGHDVGGALDVPALHEELEVGHDLVLELLEPLVELHVVLVRDRVVVLPSAGLAPVGLGQLQRVVDLGVEGAVPVGGLLVEQDGEHAGLYAELDERAAVGVGGGEDALLALVAAGGASGDVAKFWPGEVVGKHVGLGERMSRREGILGCGFIF
jgi:hypothetical protein